MGVSTQSTWAMRGIEPTRRRRLLEVEASHTRVIFHELNDQVGSWDGKSQAEIRVVADTMELNSLYARSGSSLAARLESADLSSAFGSVNVVEFGSYAELVTDVEQESSTSTSGDD